MTDQTKARDYADRLRAILNEARADGFAFTISGGRRKEFKIMATALPHVIDLSEAQEPTPEVFAVETEATSFPATA